VLDSRRLRTPATQVELRDGRVSAVIDAVRFDALVGALDELARSERLRVVDARLIGRVEPGTVRAELTFAR
jgi:type II secretory pathway component PulM